MSFLNLKECEFNQVIFGILFNLFSPDKELLSWDKKILSKFSLRGLPTTFIVNKDYKVFAKVEGIIEWDSKSFMSWLNEN